METTVVPRTLFRRHYAVSGRSRAPARSARRGPGRQVLERPSCRGPPRACEWWGGRKGPSSVGGLEGLHDGGRDAAAVADLVPVLAGPLADRASLLAVHPATAAGGPGAAGTGGAVAATAAHLAGGRDVLAEDVPQLLGVLLGQVDLVRRPVEGERDRLVSSDAVVEVVAQDHLDLACHCLLTPVAVGMWTVDIAAPCFDGPIASQREAIQRIPVRRSRESDPSR